MRRLHFKFLAFYAPVPSVSGGAISYRKAVTLVVIKKRPPPLLPRMIHSRACTLHTMQPAQEEKNLKTCWQELRAYDELASADRTSTIQLMNFPLAE